MKKSPIALATLLTATIAISGCAAFSQAVGSGKVAPDEFRVVSKAPLVVPPEFNLRPPRPGEARPLELRPDMQARSAVFGVSMGASASPGEQQLVANLGASNADPRIRDILDSETGDLARKPDSFADRLLGRRTGPMDTQAEIDATGEAERLASERQAINSATGGQAPTIQQNRSRAIKLPGM
ncbi:MAG: DUF3035 domain-containing protein [Hyphomonadaceae bacterium]|nr:DUF3035 domain-containing protein [Hyphomonadaceae bacterium]